MKKILYIILCIILIYSLNTTYVLGKDDNANNIEELKNLILEQMLLCNTDFDINFKGSADDMKILEKELNNIINDILTTQPFLNSTVTSVKSFITTRDNKIFRINVQTSFINTKEQVAEIDKAIDEILNNIIKPYMNDHERVKAVNDYIVLNGKYDTTMQYYSHYDYLTKGTAVCNGYSLLTYEMLNKLNIPVKLVFGTANSMYHVWNMVMVGDYWYHLDTTWNDPIPDKEGTVSYNYYLLTEKEITKDHTINPNQYIPESNYEYYKYLEYLSNLDKYNCHIFKRLLIETGLEVYETSHTANNLAKINKIIYSVMKYYPTKISFRYLNSIPEEKVREKISDIYKYDDVLEVGTYPIRKDVTGEYNILNIYIKYKNFPDKLDVSFSKYHKNKINYSACAHYKASRENIIKNIFIYPYNKNIMHINDYKINFTNAGSSDLSIIYKGNRIDLRIINFSDELFKNPKLSPFKLYININKIIIYDYTNNLCFFYDI